MSEPSGPTPNPYAKQPPGQGPDPQPESAQQESAQQESAQQESAQQESAQQGFAPPGPQPAIVPPGYAQPGPQPGYPQPGYAPPGYAPPGYAQPGYPQPGYPQPGYPQPYAQQPTASAPYPYPGYPQAGHQQPGAPYPYGPHQRRGGPATPPDRIGPAALAVAIIALVVAAVSPAALGTATVAAIAVAVVAVGLGIAGAVRPGARGLAIAGIATGVVAALLAGGIGITAPFQESEAAEPVVTDAGTGDDTGDDKKPDTGGDTGDDTGDGPDTTGGLTGVAAPQGSLANGGIPVGATGVAGAEVPADVVVVDVYLDYMCPYCALFEDVNAVTLGNLRVGGGVVIVYHPVSILDRLSMGTAYSTRAATAAALVADRAPEAFDSFNAAMFANQPAENTEGLTDAEIAEIAGTAGAPAEVTAAIASGAYLTDDGTFVDWVGAATEQAAADLGRLATPTVVIDGVPFASDWSQPGALESAITDAKG